MAVIPCEAREFLKRNRFRLPPCFAWILLLFGPISASTVAQTFWFEQAPISYYETEPQDAVAQLARNVDAGQVQLAYDDQFGYLPAVLQQLQISSSSQTLVFSKTSLQQTKINPRRPRAVYFNDDVYVGFCQQGEVIELAATDANQGAQFYTLRQRREGQPEFARDQGQCLACHANARTQDVPGYLVRSMQVDRAGRPMLSEGTFTTDHTSPFSERWGGWYVTGTHGQMRHMGNVISKKEREFDFESGANRNSLQGLVSTQAYLTPHSDLVALMVLEHQTQMHNALVAANFETRQALFQSRQINALRDRDPDDVTESSQRRISDAADRVLRYLLMVDEFPLASPVAGTSEFAKEFMARGKQDSHGRSLRDLDLQTRLFKYPCSYLIESPAFAALPKPVRNLVLTRLQAVLERTDTEDAYPHLSPADRVAIREILQETLPDLFQADASQKQAAQ